MATKAFVTAHIELGTPTPTNSRKDNAMIISTYSDDFKRKVVNEIKTGKWKSATQAAKAYGIDHKVVCNWLRKYGMEHLVGENAYSDDFKRKVVDEVKMGKWKNAVQSAKAYGISSGAVRNWLREYGMEHLVGETPTYSDDFKRKVVDEIKMGKWKNAKRAAKAYGLSGNAVCNWLREYGMGHLIVEKATYSDDFKRKVVDEVKTGKWKNATQAAKAYGLNGGAVCNWLREYGMGHLVGENAYSDDFKRKVVNEIKMGKWKNAKRAADAYGPSLNVVCNWLREYGMGHLIVEKATYSDDFKRKVVDEVKTGKWKSATQAADAYGLSSNAVCNWLRKYGMEHLVGENAYSDDFKRKVVNEIKTGKWKNAVQSAKAYGISSGAVRNWLREYGMEHLVGETPTYSDDFKRKVVNEIKTGKWKSATQAAKAYGIDHKVVCNWLRKYGMEHLIGAPLCASIAPKAHTPEPLQPTEKSVETLKAELEAMLNNLIDSAAAIEAKLANLEAGTRN